MKKSIILLTLLVALLWVTQSCSDDAEQSTAPRDVSFSLGLLRGDDAAGRTAAEIPDGASVMITLTKADGTPVLSQERIPILRMGSGLITTPIRLAPGDYTITDFWVVQDSSEVLFLIPKAGSPLAAHVSKPVPFNFSVNADGVTSISVQVIATQDQEPEDFGYVSFTLSVADPAELAFRVAVFVRNGNELVLTDATAFLIGSMDFQQYIPLEAKVNAVIHERGIFGRGFQLFIHKPGYVSYVHEMALPENAPQYKDIPLEVILEDAIPLDSPSISLFGHWTFPGSGPINLSFEGAGTVFIDWGDGYTTKEPFDGGTLLRTHFHVKPWRTISVRNDLDKIVAMEAGLGVSYPDGLETIDIREAVNLRSLKLHEVKLDKLDLSHQTKLETLIIEGVSTQTPTILPTEHNLRDVRFSYWTDDYRALVDNIYANTVAKNIRNGYFWHSRTVPHEFLPQDVVDKIGALHDLYGWEIHVNQ